MKTTILILFVAVTAILFSSCGNSPSSSGKLPPLKIEVPAELKGNVITSYSIHYTKLYDAELVVFGCSRCRFGNSSLNYHQEVAINVKNQVAC